MVAQRDVQRVAQREFVGILPGIHWESAGHCLDQRHDFFFLHGIQCAGFAPKAYPLGP